MVSSKHLFLSWCAVKIWTLWPWDASSTAASTTNLSAPPTKQLQGHGNQLLVWKKKLLKNIVQHCFIESIKRKSNNGNQTQICYFRLNRIGSNRGNHLLPIPRSGWIIAMFIFDFVPSAMLWKNRNFKMKTTVAEIHQRMPAIIEWGVTLEST